MNTDLNTPGVPKAVATRVKEDIEEFAVRTFDEGPRNHLGASLIGEECERKLWLLFRWCFHEKHTGRMLRLFNRGHREEPHFIRMLEGIGCKVWWENREAPKNEKGEYPQYRICGVNGHFGGSLDAIILLPERYGISEPVLGEFKTHNTGSHFASLLSTGMQVNKPMHFAQTSTYGLEYKFNYVLYLSVCKNDDNLHVELAKLDHKLGERMKLKAERIICSQVPMPRISDNPTFSACVGCAAKAVCHTGASPLKNCRSCHFATPIADAKWFCKNPRNNGIIPNDFIKIGCDLHESILHIR